MNNKYFGFVLPEIWKYLKLFDPQKYSEHDNETL
jgi:hypothetical protein